MVSLVRKYGWHEWLCHTNFSFLAGASHPEEYVKRATKLGYRGIGICDYDGVYGIVRAYRAAQKILEQGVETPPRLFYGSEFHLEQDHHKPLIFQNTLTTLAPTQEAYFALCKMASYSHRGGKRNPWIPLEKITENAGHGLIFIQPMRGLIRSGEKEKLVKKLTILKDCYQDNLFLSISCHLNPSEDCWIAPTLKLAKSLSIPILFSQDPYFHHPKEKDLCDLVQAMRHNLTMDQCGEHFFINNERCLLPLDIIEERYRQIPGYHQGLKNARLLSEVFNFTLEKLRYQYPKEMIPESHTPHSFLKEIALKSAMEVYHNNPPDRIISLIHKELKLIKTLAFEDYFLTVWDIVHWARKQGILCQGRGSAANSAICFVLGITSVNPDCFDLLFERFMSLERGDPPDIDVDFEHERREEVIQYIYHRYGRNKAAMVANIITFKSRGAIRFTGKALGIPESYIKEASSLQETRSYRQGKTAKVIGQSKDQILWKHWIRMSERSRQSLQPGR